MNYRKALKFYQEAHRRLQEQIRQATVSGTNVKAGAKVAKILISLQVLSQKKPLEPEKLEQALQEIREIKAALSDDPNEAVKKSELFPLFSLVIQALEAGIVPDDSVILGNILEAGEEIKRIASEMEKQGKILKIKEDIEE